jgi:hypothetical protein
VAGTGGVLTRPASTGAIGLDFVDGERRFNQELDSVREGGARLLAVLRLEDVRGYQWCDVRTAANAPELPPQPCCLHGCHRSTAAVSCQETLRRDTWPPSSSVTMLIAVEACLGPRQTSFAPLHSNPREGVHDGLLKADRETAWWLAYPRLNCGSMG